MQRGAGGSVGVLWVDLAVSAIISKVQVAGLTVVVELLWPLPMTLTAMMWQYHVVLVSLAVMWLVLWVGRGMEMVGLGVVWDRLVVPVDIPMSLSRHSSLSWSAICITALVKVVGVIWVLKSIGMLAVDPVCMPSLTWIHVHGSTHLPWLCFVSYASRSAIFPCSSSSFSPFSIRKIAFVSRLP
jgi:hypothetical protein